jgi:hypothetical protein
LDSPPPPCESDCGPNNWTPYAGRVEFELADFIYRQNQMSASDIDTLLLLWDASAAIYGESPPFKNHKDLYNTIDATPLGDIAWKSFSLQFNGILPEGEVPSWMGASYDVWFRDPHELVFTILLPIQTLRMDLTTPHIRSALQMDLVATIILCQQIGHGNRQ